MIFEGFEKLYLICLPRYLAYSRDTDPACCYITLRPMGGSVVASERGNDPPAPAEIFCIQWIQCLRATRGSSPRCVGEILKRRSIEVAISQPPTPSTLCTIYQLKHAWRICVQGTTTTIISDVDLRLTCTYVCCTNLHVLSEVGLIPDTY